MLSAIIFVEDVRNVLPMLAKVLADGQRPWEQLKRQMASLEWRVLYQTDFRLMTPTPVAFLHLFLGRTVSQGALAQHSTPAVGAVATNITCRNVAEGLGVYFYPSELATAALHLAVLQECGANTAANVAVVTGSDLYCPRFIWLCRKTTSWAGATTSSAGAQVFTVKRHLAGDSDTDGITPLPSADVQGPHGGFFQEEQVRGLLVRPFVS